MNAKRIEESRVILSRMMGPQDANSLGNVHGGVIMKMVDETGALAAMRHAQNIVVTVAIDSMTFKKPIHIGDIVIVKAELTYAGRTSMEVRVDVTAEHPITGGEKHTNSAYAVYVALDGEGNPSPIPGIELVTDAEKLRWEAAQQRQQYRKEQQRKEEALHYDE